MAYEPTGWSPTTEITSGRLNNLEAGVAAAHQLSADTANGSVIATKFGALGDGLADDTQALQDWLDTAEDRGYRVPSDLVLPAGTYRISDALEIPHSKETRIRGMGRGVSRIVQHQDGVPIFRFVAPNTYGITLGDLALEYEREQVSGANGVAIAVDVGSSRHGVYHNRFHDLIVRRANTVAKIITQQSESATMWNSHFENILAFNVVDGAIHYWPDKPIGIPMTTIRNFAVINTLAPRTTSGDYLFRFRSAEVFAVGLDIEGWHNGLVLAAGEAMHKWLQVHVEHHEVTRNDPLFDLNSRTRYSLENVSVNLEKPAPGLGDVPLVAGDSGAHVEMDGLRLSGSSAAHAPGTSFVLHDGSAGTFVEGLVHDLSGVIT